MVYHALNEIFSRSFQNLKKYLSPILLTGLVLYFVPFVIASIIQFSLGIHKATGRVYGSTVSLDPATMAINLVIQIVVGLLGLLFSVSVIRLVHERLQVKDATVGTIISNGLPYLLRAFAASLLVSLAIMAIILPIFMASVLLGPIGMLLILPGVILILILVIYWMFVIYAVVADNVPVTKSLSYSMRLVKGSWWRIFGYVLLIAVILGAMGFVLMIIFGVPAFILGPLGRFLMTVVFAAFGLVVIPFMNIFYYELYQALKDEKGITSSAGAKNIPQDNLQQ